MLLVSPESLPISRKQQLELFIIGNAIYTTGSVSISYTTGGVYKRLYTPPALVRRTHLGRSRKRLEYLGMGWGYHGNYHGAETVQSSKSYGPLQNIVRYVDRWGISPHISDTHHRWYLQALIYTTGARSPHTPPAYQKTAGICRHGLGVSWKLSWSRNGPVIQELWAPLEYLSLIHI